MTDINPMTKHQSVFVPVNSGTAIRIAPKDVCLSPNGSMRNKPGQDSLATACQDFEAVLVNYLLKTMRESVPKSGFLEEGNDVEFYRGLMDWEIATKASRQGQFGLWKTLYRQLAGHDPDLMAPAGTKPGTQTPIGNNDMSGGPREIPVERTADYLIRGAGGSEPPVSASEDSGADDSP